MTVRAPLFSFLDELSIAHRTVDHPPVFTVEEGKDIKATMPGGHSKNLFLRDKKSVFTLITALSQTPIDLVALGKEVGTKGRFSFAKPESMQTILGVTPGSVTPFALMNAKGATEIGQVILDQALFDHDPVWFHPLENTASTAIAPAGLVRFVEACGYVPRTMPLASITR